MLVVGRFTATICGRSGRTDQGPTPIAPATSFPSPALGERRHGLLAPGRVAVRRVLDLPVVAARRHPGATRWRDRHLEDAPHHDAVLRHVIVVVAPLAGRARGGCAFEDERE